jgi:DNA-binding response OmpR family regulator
MEIRTERNLLMIDDEPYFSELVKDILTGAHCTITTFSDPHAGLREALMRNDLDLILLDIEMPELNGLEILRQIKKSHNHTVPVMMLTAHAEMAVVTQALNQGAQDYLLKPFSVKMFAKRLNKLLQTDIFKHLPASEASQSAELPKGPQAQPLILYFETDPEAILAIEEILKDSVCQLLICQESALAKQALEEQDPDLILMALDTGKEGLRDLDTLRQLKPKTPLIVLTTDLTDHTRTEANKHHLNAYLQKPCPIHVLIGQLEKALQIPLFAGRL